MATVMARPNTCTLDTERCSGCGLCVEVCPQGVLAIRGRKAVFVRYEACIECGACQRNCPAAAIAVESGVGCAAAFIRGILTGREPSCGCDDDRCGGASSCC